MGVEVDIEEVRKTGRRNKEGKKMVVVRLGNEDQKRKMKEKRKFKDKKE